MQLAELVMGSVAVTAGAAVGTPARFFISGVVARRFGETFPWGTLVVNASGCLAMGALAAFVQAHGLSAESLAWLVAGTGFLGSYTTVSSFALQTHALVKEGELRDAVGYIVLSLALCLAAVAAGVAGGRLAFAAGGA